LVQFLTEAAENARLVLVTSASGQQTGYVGGKFGGEGRAGAGAVRSFRLVLVDDRGAAVAKVAVVGGAGTIGLHRVAGTHALSNHLSKHNSGVGVFKLCAEC